MALYKSVISLSELFVVLYKMSQDRAMEDWEVTQRLLKEIQVSSFGQPSADEPLPVYIV